MKPFLNPRRYNKWLRAALALTLAITLSWVSNSQATTGFYQNDGTVSVPPQFPPQVDATNFVNNGFFSINFTNFLTESYKTASVLNFTNNGMIIGNGGFQFDTGPVSSGQRRMAANFENRGTISAGSSGNTNVFADFFGGLGFSGLPQIHIWATNVLLNSGITQVGVDGRIAITGKKVDLTRASILVEGFDDGANVGVVAPFGGSDGIFDSYWGIGTNVMVPQAQFDSPFSPPQTPLSRVNSRYGTLFTVLALPAATTYVKTDIIDTNIFARAVFISNTNSAISNNVYMDQPGQIVVEWVGTYTNLFNGSLATNYLYLEDDFGPRPLYGRTWVSRLLFRTNYYSVAPTAVPTNYFFYRAGSTRLFYGTNATPNSVANYFTPPLAVTNQFAAYQAIFAPSTVLPSDLPPGGQFKDLPGRISISAESSLDMSRARLVGANYLNLSATNHFIGSSRAQVSVPLCDIALRSTNGTLSMTNILFPSVPRYSGSVSLWSGRWTNDIGGFRYMYHVLFVDSQMSPVSLPLVQDLSLTSTNAATGDDSIVVNDIFNVSRNLMLNTRRLTIASNAAGAQSLTGEINLRSTAIVWPSVTPRLQYFTNYGMFSSGNAVFFGGTRSSPFYTSNYNEPYIGFVNRGSILTEGNLIWANYFENRGLINSGINFGSINLESRYTHLRDGSFNAFQGDISVVTGELVVTNHSLLAGRRLTLSATNLLTDGGSRDANFWNAGNGFRLLAQPNNGDLLGTTILSAAAPGAEVFHAWAGQDRGPSVTGFANNGALGRLILDGGFDSLYRFSPIAGATNALYVDSLEFRDYAGTTIINSEGNVEGVEIDPNMIIYYAQALATDGSVAERINGANGGRFRWIAAYTGYYSSTNIVYGDGTTHVFNAALAQSCNLDSDGDGLVNCSDPEPFLLAQGLALQVTSVITPSRGVSLSWRSMPGSANRVYYRAGLAGPWQSLTNFVNSNLTLGPVSVFDPINGNTTRYYRVEVDAPQP